MYTHCDECIPSFLPVRATIVVTGSRGTGLIGLLSRCVARMGNGIKSLFPLKYHRDRITDSDPEETDECIPIAAYPFVSDRNAARLDNNPMSPVPREPVTTIVERAIVRNCVL